MRLNVLYIGVLIASCEVLCDKSLSGESLLDRNLWRALSILLVGILMCCFITTDFIWIAFVIWELMSLISAFLVYECRVANRRSFLFTLGISLLSGAGFLYSIIELPFNALFTGALFREHFAHSIPVQIGLAIAIICKSGLFPFLWPQAASVAHRNVSAYLHSATVIQAGLYLAVKLDFELNLCVYPVFHSIVTYFSYTTLIWGFFYLIFQNDFKKNLACLTQCSIASSLLLCGEWRATGYGGHTEYILQSIALHGFYKSTLFLYCSKKQSGRIADIVYTNLALVISLIVIPHPAYLHTVIVDVVKALSLVLLIKFNFSLIGQRISFKLGTRDIFGLLMLAPIIGPVILSPIIGQTILDTNSFQLHCPTPIILVTILFAAAIVMLLSKTDVFLITFLNNIFIFRTGLFNAREYYIDHAKILPKVRNCITFIRRTFYHTTFIHKVFLYIENTLILVIFIVLVIQNATLDNFIGNRLLGSNLQHILLIPFIFGLFLINSAKNKLDIIAGLNIISTVVCLLFLEHGGIEIAATHLVSDLITTVCLLGSSIGVKNEDRPNWLVPVVMMILSIILHKSGGAGLIFPVPEGANIVNEVVVNWRLLDTLGEVLVFYLAGKLFAETSFTSSK